MRNLGKVVFDLKNELGFPCDFSFAYIAEKGVPFDWIAFIERARECGWWDFQLYREIKHSLIDAEIRPSIREAVLDAFKRYVVANPHPRMA